MKSKVDKKTNKMTLFIFLQREEKKNPAKFNHHFAVYTCCTNKKCMGSRFKHHSKKLFVNVERYYKRQ